jgi:hypothetical protein
MANIAGSYDTEAQPSGDFEPIPAGEYRAKIIESSIEEISSTDNKGRCLKLTWQIETGPYDGRLVWDRLNMWAENMIGKKGEDAGRDISGKVQSIANSQFAAIREATGRMTPQDSSELHDIPCTIRVAVRVDPTGRYQPSNEIKAVKPVASGGQGRTAPPAQQRQAPQVNRAPANNSGESAPWRQRQTA